MSEQPHHRQRHDTPQPSGRPDTRPDAPVPAAAREPVSHGLAMKRRHPWAVWLLSLVTVGIYYLVWWYKIHAEMAQYDPRQPIAPVTSLCAVTIGGLIIIPPYVSTATAGGRISRAQRAAGLRASCSGGLGLLLFLLFGLSAVYYQSELNKVIDVYAVADGTRVPLYA